MEKKTNKILVTSFASNVARMESIFYCAKKTGRSISLVGRSMHRIYKAAKKCGYLKGLLEPIDPREAKKFSKNKIVFLATGSQGEPMGAMNRIINGIHPDVFLESGDCVIFSSKIIPGNEKKLYQLQNQIVKNNIEIISEENAFVHVSGHPNRDDLKDMYKWVKPQCVIPVHGEHRHMVEHVDFAKEMQVPKTLLIENGDIIKILPGSAPKIIDKAPSGRFYLDGNLGVEADSQSIKDRKNLSVNGYLEITIIVSNNGKIKKPIISFKGIPEKNENDTFIFDVEDEIFNICKTFSLQTKNQEKNLIETIKQNCRKIVKSKTGKRPFTNINIARI
jgi:ribonuclease J